MILTQRKLIKYRNLHFVEIGDFSDVNEVDNSEILHLFSNVVQDFIHFHAHWIPIVSKTNDLQPTYQ